MTSYLRGQIKERFTEEAEDDYYDSSECEDDALQLLEHNYKGFFDEASVDDKY